MPWYFLILDKIKRGECQNAFREKFNVLCKRFQSGVQTFRILIWIELNFQATSRLASLVIAVQLTVMLCAWLNSYVFEIMDFSLQYLGVTNCVCSRLFPECFVIWHCWTCIGIWQCGDFFVVLRFILIFTIRYCSVVYFFVLVLICFFKVRPMAI